MSVLKRDKTGSAASGVNAEGGIPALKKIAIVGNPNVGRSVMLNNLTAG